VDEFEARKRRLLQPLFLEAGAALLDCQTFEYLVGLLLYYLGLLHGDTGLYKKMDLILDNVDKKTAGQLIVLLKKHVIVSEGIENALEKALRARNQLIHRVMVDNFQKIVREEPRAALVKEVRRLRGQVKECEKTLTPFLEFFEESLGIKYKEFEKQIRENFS
jgi:hypothetical protein